MKNHTRLLLPALTLLFILATIAFPAPVESRAEMEKQLEQHPAPEKKRKLLANLAYIYKQIKPTKALAYGKEAMELLQEYPDENLRVKVLIALCWTYAELGLFNDGLNYGREAEILTQKLGNYRQTAVAAASIFNAYCRLGDYEKALNYALKTLTIYEEHNDEIRIGRALINVGNVYFFQEQYEEAFVHYSRALEIIKKTDSQNDIAHALTSIASYYTYIKQYSKAERFYLEAQKIMEANSNTVGSAQILSNLALNASDKGDHSQALQYDLKALILWEAIGDKKNTAHVLGSIARDYSYLGKHKEAEPFIKRALTQGRKLGTLDLKRDIYEIMSMIYEIKKDYAEALKWERESKNLHQQIFSDARNQNMSNLQVVYDVSKKEKENALLKKENRIQELQLNRQRIVRNFSLLVAFLVCILALFIYKRYRIKKKTEQVLRESEQSLKRMNDAKDKLFTIIAHDLGSPLNDLLLSARHLARNYKLLEEEDIDDSIQYMFRQTTSMASMLDNLLKWAMTQIGKMECHPGSLDIRALGNDAVRQARLVAENKGISLAVQIHESIRAWGDGNMVVIVLRNLVANAVKYTAAGGQIIVDAKKIEHHIHLSVSDNGIGMPPEVMTQLFKMDVHHSTRGTANEKGTGLGLLLCKELVEKNEGSINVQSNPGKGSRFTFTIPASNEPPKT
ncbi:MAG: sensor histidine kinase [bacterium]|nr:sensor histidine kinase [bacterium]